MKENIFRYQVTETNSGITEERLIIGKSKGTTYNYATTAYLEGDNWEVTKVELAGILSY